MATQTISTTGDIPEILDPFYLGRPGEGTVGQPGYKNQLQVFLIEGLLQFSLKTLQQVLGLLVQKPMPKGSSL
jgi:hypothetical protein